MYIRAFYNCFCFFVSLFIFTCCSEIDETDDFYIPEVDDSELSILAIGNSFTIDGTQYLPNLIESYKLDGISVATLTVGGTSLDYHYTHALENDAVYEFRISRKGKFNSLKRKGIIDALKYKEWDYIVLQQLSNLSGRYDSYQPYLNNLIEIIRKYQPYTTIAWQLTWAYNANTFLGGFTEPKKRQEEMYNSIIDAVYQMQKETGIETIIPTGIAIQYIRDTYKIDELEYTCDGHHLDLGAGRYIAACTWYETLIKPHSGIDILDNPFRTTQGNIPVTDKNYRIFQEAAYNAVYDWYNNYY